MFDFSAKKLRSAMKDKIARLVRTDPKAKVDASGYTPPDALDADVKTGARPISRRQFRKGGKVVAMHGEMAKHHAGRKPRKSGGKALTANSLVNRNVREANEERDGIKHVGAFKDGGSTWGDSTPLRLKKTLKGPKGHTAKVYKDPDWNEYRVKFYDSDGKHLKDADHHTDDMGDALNTAQNQVNKGYKRGGAAHDDVAEDKKLIKSMVKHEAIKPGKSHGGSCRCAKCSGGSMGRAEGGKNWIKDAIKHPGSLHKALHVPKDEKIPAKKLEKATHSDKPGLARKANLAKTLKGFHKKADGGGFDGPLITPKGSDAPMARGMRPTDGLVPFVPTVKKVVPGMTRPTAGDLNDMRGAANVARLKGVPIRKRGGKLSVSDGELEGTRPTGGRRARAYGGELMGHSPKKKDSKTNINIIIGMGKGKDGMTPPATPAVPPRLPTAPVVVPPAGAGAPAGIGAAPPVPPVAPVAPVGAPAGMPGRKAGGRVGHRSYKSVKDFDAGSGSGLGRLEKVKVYGHKA